MIHYIFGLLLTFFSHGEISTANDTYIDCCNLITVINPFFQSETNESEEE